MARSRRRGGGCAPSTSSNRTRRRRGGGRCAARRAGGESVESAWAVVARTGSAGLADLARLIADGTVVRTHALRRTWHYVAADEIAGDELTAPGPLDGRATVAHAARDDDTAVDRCSTRALDGLGAELTRTELPAPSLTRGARSKRHAVMILLAELELQALICSGERPPTVRTPTRDSPTGAVSPRRLDRDEALAEAGPAVLHRRRPGHRARPRLPGHLPTGDVRVGLAQTRGRLDSFDLEGRTFWHAPADPPATGGTPAGHLPDPRRDVRGNQDSRWALDAEGIVPRTCEVTGHGPRRRPARGGDEAYDDADQVTFDLRPTAGSGR